MKDAACRCGAGARTEPPELVRVASAAQRTSSAAARPFSGDGASAPAEAAAASSKLPHPRPSPPADVVHVIPAESTWPPRFLCSIARLTCLQMIRGQACLVKNRKDARRPLIHAPAIASCPFCNVTATGIL